MALEAVFAFDSNPADRVAEIVLTSVVGESMSSTVVLSGQSVDVKRLCSEVRSRKHFDIEIAAWKVAWGGVKNYDHALLTIKNAQAPLAEHLLFRVAHLAPWIAGRSYDSEYDHWQNAEDPLEFESVGRSMVALPMKSNGLPAPLEQMIVDTSETPGRRVLRNGYVEAIGHRMWLGSEFFARVPGADREEVLRDPTFETRELEDGILEVVAHPEPFVDGSTSEIQDRLRRLLFPA